MFLNNLLVDDVETGVFAQAFGHHDAFGSLVVFQKGGHYSGQSERRAVEGVTEMSLLVIAAVTAFEAVCLICLEVGNRRHLEPAALGGGVDFEVEGDGRSEAHVASAETEYMPGQTEFLEQTLYVGFHLFKSGIAVLGLLYAYDLYLVELMQTVEATHVLAIAACLAAEACRVSAILDRELVGRYDYIAVKVSHRNLGGRNEVELVEIHKVHLAFFVGKLACAVARSLVDNVRGLHLEVACSRSLVEEELNESALKLGALAEINGESGAGDLYAEVEVDEVVFLGEIPVGEGVGAEIGHGAAGEFHYIVGGSLAFGYSLAGNVGDIEEFVADSVLGAAEFFGYGFLLFLEHCHGLFCGLGLVAASVLHGLAYGISLAFEVGGGVVVAELEATAQIVEREHAVDRFFGIEAFHGQALDDISGVGLYLLECKHLICNCRVEEV